MRTCASIASLAVLTSSALTACGEVNTSNPDASPEDVDAAPPPPPVEFPDAGPDAAPAPDAGAQVRCRVSWHQGATGSRSVWVGNPDGSDPVQVSGTVGDNTGGQWSPNGQKLLIATNREGNWDLMTVGPDGSLPTNLTKQLDRMHGEASDTQGVWSPDGSKIVFNRGADLWVMSADGAIAGALSTLPNLQSVSWSPDGRSVLASSRSTAAGAKNDLYIIPIAGGTARPVGNTPTVDEYPGGFSPDGSRIVFAALGNSPGSKFDVFVSSPDGSGTLNITPNTPDSSESTAIFAPDGSAVLFSSTREGGAKVFSVPVGGGAATRITDNNLTGLLAGDYPRAATPDGSRLLFTRYVTTRETVVGTIGIDGADVRTWPSGGIAAQPIAWSCH
jgi:Tol biopolymer transport system component